MLNRAHLITALAIVVLLAGCTETPGGPQAVGASAGTSGSGAPPATGATDLGGPADEVGTVVGLVTNDEGLPLSEAEVSVEGFARLTTEADGRFTFTGVPAGEYTVFAAHLGYQSAGRGVTVKIGEEVEVNLVLVALQSTEAFYESFPHTAMYGLSSGYVNEHLRNYVPQCTGCQWTVNTTGIAQYLLVEIHGKHTYSHPLTKDRDHFNVNELPSRRSVGPYGYMTLPIEYSLNETQIKEATSMVMWLRCDFEWFCYQEKREAWVTAFHFMAIPDGFTAFPK